MFAQIKGGVAASALVFLLVAPAAGSAQQRSEAELLDALRDAAPEEVDRITSELVNRWSSSGSDAMDFLLKRGRDAIEVQDWPRAVEHLTALTDHAPDFAEGYYNRALAYFRMERFGPAMADLERALALNPNHFAALRGVASILEVLDRPEQALAAYDMVLEFSPHDEEAQAGRERMSLASEGQAL